jgi:hypothetical protein
VGGDLHRLRGRARLQVAVVGGQIEQARSGGVLAEAQEGVDGALLVPHLVVGAPAHRGALLEQAAGVEVDGGLVVAQPGLHDRGGEGDGRGLLVELVALDHGDEELRVLDLPVVHRVDVEALAGLGAGEELLGPDLVLAVAAPVPAAVAAPSVAVSAVGVGRGEGAERGEGGDAEGSGEQQVASGRRGGRGGGHQGSFGAEGSGSGELPGAGPCQRNDALRTL